jgi:hypothetical protein
MKIRPLDATVTSHPASTKRATAAWRDLLCCGLGLLLSVASLRAGEFFIRDGDRVVFLGDSITQQRLYTTYIEAYALTRFPAWKLSFRNVGWGGDTAWLRQRYRLDENLLFASDEAGQAEMVSRSVGSGLQRDVLPLKPTVVTVNFGMNDHHYEAFRPDIFRAYVRAQAEIARVLTAQGARVAFLTPQPMEEKRVDPDQDVRNQSLRKFSDGLRDVAARANVRFADEFDPYLAVMLGSRSAMVGQGDAVHPGPPGHTIMAWALLKALGATPLVSSATLNAQAGRVESAQACKIDQVKSENGTLTFDRLDEALPMPIDPKADSALSLVPVLNDLNVYELKITGLPAGQYTIQIDGETVATVTAGELADGWNLARSAGPVTEQAQNTLSLIIKKNDEYFKRWRNVQLFTAPDWAVPAAELEKNRQTELARLDQQIADLESAIDIARQPKLRHFRVAPALKGS